jgi:hypothetical protein
MPYKNAEQKREWELQHRFRRLARRRELRQIEAARIAALPEPIREDDGGASILLPLVAATALAAYNPILAIGCGGLTVLVAGVYKKGLNWWIAGVLILIIGLFFQWKDQATKQ